MPNCLPEFAGPLVLTEFFDDHTSWQLFDGRQRQSIYDAEMPRIEDRNLDGVAYLFRTEQEAQTRRKIGGSAFIVSRIIDGSEDAAGQRLYVPYLISNRHVVYEGGASVVSMNRRDGGPPDIFDFLQTDWSPHPADEDLIAICMHGHLRKDIHRITHMPTQKFVTEEVVTEYQIGVGDEVFMVGRFINHQGGYENRPAARFGSISMMPEPLWNSATRRHQESYAVEMRSRTGFSGAPVAVYRTLATVLADIPQDKLSYFGLLGVNWGHVKDEETGESTWLNGVVPAWKILELLDTPPLLARQNWAKEKLFELLEDQSGVEVAAAFEQEPPI